MPLILFNIGWMKHYRGQPQSDRIFNGGKYVLENKTGNEIENFKPLAGRCYAYVSARANKINLCRVGAKGDADYMDGVTVVFTATRPTGGTVVVGWYRNARVWCKGRSYRGRIYYAEADSGDCTLLACDNRVFPVPRAGTSGVAFGIGQNNVRYLDKPNAQAFSRKIGKYMKDPNAATALEDGSPSRGRSAGGMSRQSDPILRDEVEKAAIQHVMDYHTGYECISVESENKGWDLEFRRGAVTLLVEVKGCSGVGQVELTPNEYSAMRSSRYRESYRLAIVLHALVSPSLSIIRFNGSDKSWRDQHDRKVKFTKVTGARVSLG